MHEPGILLRSGKAQRSACWQCMQPHRWHAGERTAAKADLEHLVALAHAFPGLNVGQGVPARWPQAFITGMSCHGIAACLQLLQLHPSIQACSDSGRGLRPGPLA